MANVLVIVYQYPNQARWLYWLWVLLPWVLAGNTKTRLKVGAFLAHKVIVYQLTRVVFTGKLTCAIALYFGSA